MNVPSLASADVMDNSKKAELKAKILHNGLATKLHQQLEGERWKIFRQAVKAVLKPGVLGRCDNIMDVFNKLDAAGYIEIGQYDLLSTIFHDTEEMNDLYKIVKDTEKKIKDILNTQATESGLEPGRREDTARGADSRESGSRNAPVDPFPPRKRARSTATGMRRGTQDPGPPKKKARSTATGMKRATQDLGPPKKKARSTATGMKSATQDLGPPKKKASSTATGMKSVTQDPGPPKKIARSTATGMKSATQDLGPPKKKASSTATGMKSATQDPGPTKKKARSTATGMISATNDPGPPKKRALVTAVQGEPGPEDVPPPRYKMEAAIRGKCLIISNWSFPTLGNLDGHQIDSKNCASLFSGLNFEIVRRNNLSKRQMDEEVEKISKEDHSLFDCFVCCILSHGDTDIVFGIDGQGTPPKDITSWFKADKCPSLEGKPKLFLFQACKGNGRDVEIPRTAGATPSRTVKIESIPTGADFFMGYSTIDGYVCYVYDHSGSLYIRSLVKILTDYANRHDLLTMMTMVNNEVAETRSRERDREGFYKQIPCQQSTLRKLVYFLSERPQ